MIPISPALIKSLIGIAAIAAILLYVKHLNTELAQYKADYELEKSAYNEVLDTLTDERVNSIKAHEEALALEAKFNEIHTQNTKYRDCVSKRNCYVSLRRPETKTTGTLSTASTTGTSTDDSSGEFDTQLQQSILDLREEVEKASTQIIGLQAYINTYCYKSN